MNCVNQFVHARVDGHLYPRLLKWSSETCALRPGTQTRVIGGVRCLYATPTGTRPPRGATLYLHGNAMTLRTLWDTGLINRVAEATQTVVYAPDYVGYGLDVNDTGASGLWGDKLDRAQGARVRRVLSCLPHERVTVMGRSLGASLATAAVSGTSAYDSKVRGLILISPFRSLCDMVPPMLMWSDALVRYFVQGRLDNAVALQRVNAALPVQVIAGTDDSLVPSAQSKSLYLCRKDVQSRDTAGFHLVPGMTHSNMLGIRTFPSVLKLAHDSCIRNTDPPASVFAIASSDSDE